jgi:hypothetical protein
MSGYQNLYSSRVPGRQLVEHIIHSCEESSACYSVCVALQARLKSDEGTRFLQYLDIAFKQYRLEIGDGEHRLSRGTLVAGLLLCSINVSRTPRRYLDSLLIGCL